jgi:hypothetical protein
MGTQVKETPGKETEHKLFQQPCEEISLEMGRLLQEIGVAQGQRQPTQALDKQLRALEIDYEDCLNRQKIPVRR